MGGESDTWHCLFRRLRRTCTVRSSRAADVAEVVVKWSVSVWAYALRPQRAGLLLNMRRREQGGLNFQGLRTRRLDQIRSGIVT